MMFSALLLPVLMAEPAHAWRHTRKVWDRNKDFPFEWYISDSREDSWSDQDTTTEEILLDAWDIWEEGAKCAGLTHSYQGVREGHNAGYTFDNVNTFYFDDPGDELGTGVLGATLTLPAGGDLAFQLGGDSYTYVSDSDIVFNNDIVWFSDEQIARGQCSGGNSLLGVATHEIGHLWGMGHSCEEGENCPDLDQRYATMYWANSNCSLNQSKLESDDIQGITALYGPYAAFDSDSKRNGGAPLEVCFDLELDESNDNLNIEWNFGDGTISVEPIYETDDNGNFVYDEDGKRILIPVCHTYDSAGQFSVNMNVTGTQEECGDWRFTQRELAYVTVCEAPIPAEGFKGLFTYEPIEDTIYQMVNQVDTSVYGCIERIRWDIFEAGSDTLVNSVSAWSPKIDFPKAGKYRVVLNVGAPGDLFSADELLIDVEEVGGCSTAPASGGLAGLLIGLIGLLVRRRD